MAAVPWRGLLENALSMNGIKEPEALADAEGRSLTMAELQESASFVARLIWGASEGIEETVFTGGDVPLHGNNLTVAIFVEKSAVCVVAALGTLFAGAKFVDVPQTSKASEIARIINVVEPDLVLTSKEMRAKLVDSNAKIDEAKVLLIDEMPMLAGPPSPSEAPPKPIAFLPTDPDEEGAGPCSASVSDGAFCVLTSGTTSLAKIVVCPHAALTSATPYFDGDLGVGDRVGLFWVYYYMFSVLGEGASLFVLPDSVFFDPEALVETVRAQRLTGLYVTPSILTSCLEGLADEVLTSGLATLRVVWLTGEKVTSKMRAKLRRLLPTLRVRDVYSTNESGDLGIADEDGSFAVFDEVEFEVREPQSGALMPTGQTGALHVRCPWLYKGYWTAEGIGYTAGADEWFRTGDLVRCTGGQAIEFVSREGSAHIKVRGFKVFPELIEAELTKHPDIEAAWCAAVGDAEDDTLSRLEAAVALKQQSTLGSNALRSFMAERVPSYMVPVTFRRMDFGAKSPSPALSEDEARVAAAWATALKLPVTAFNPQSNFFDFGGSLAFVTLAKVVDEAFGTSVLVKDLLQVPTLQAMTARLFAYDGSADEPAYDAVAEAEKYPIVQQLKELPPLDASAAAAVRTSTLVRYQALAQKSVLVTGTTGYVGAFLMQALARRPDVARVHCLVRAKDVAGAAERLRKTCARRAIDDSDDFEAWFAKVVPIPGDVGQVRLGLSPEQYATLCCTVHSVVHAAAEVNMLKPPEALGPTNVGGTSNVLSFAALGALPVAFTSTMLPLDGAAPSGYRQSKGAAEQLLATAGDRYGVPSSVLQLGDIGIGLSTSPLALPDDDYVVILLRTCIALGLFPLAEWAVSIIPVDQCAGHITQLLLAAAEASFTSRPQEVKGDLVRWATLHEWLVQELPMLETCSLDEFARTIAHVGEHGEADGYAAEVVAGAKRVQLLLPSMEHEFSAEEQRRLRGEGAHGLLTIDEAWGRRFGAALAAETRAKPPARVKLPTIEAMAANEEVPPTPPTNERLSPVAVAVS